MRSASAKNPAPLAIAAAAALALALTGGAGCLGDASTPRAVASVAVGGACGDDWECQSGVCIAETESGAATGWSGGTCTTPCGSGGACGAGGACAALGGQPWCLASCGRGVACRSGYICNTVDSTCLPDCRNAGFSCGAGYLCGGDGRCLVAPSPLAPPGGPCARDANCSSGYCFTATVNGAPTGWSGGTCAAPCTTAGCGPGGACAVLGGEAWCVASCGNGAACRAGYLCNTADSTCLPDCHNPGWSCGAGYACGSDGRCAVSPASLAPVGASCGGDAQCQSGLCFTATSNGSATGWSGGTCAAPCVGGACTSGGACAVLGGTPWCIASCAGGAACRGGYLCNTADSTCLPDCRNPGWSCGAGYACGSDGRCAVAAAALAPVGAACARSSDCATGLCFAAAQGGVATGWTGGTCADVAPGGACTAAGAAPVVLSGQQWCVAGCSATAGCRAGYVCDPDFKACLPECHTPGWSCGSGLSCGADGTCAASNAVLASNGAPCSGSAQCKSGYCQPSSAGGVPLGFPADFCSAVCGPGLPLCAAGSSCAPSQVGSRCFAGCVSSADCAAGFLCNPASLANPSPACLPDCRTPGASCGPPPRSCNQTTGLCF